MEIPSEVVTLSSEMLYVGIYGTDGEDMVAIPTVWASLCVICGAADPSGDESTNPELPVWAQLQEEINELKENTIYPGDGVPGASGEDRFSPIDTVTQTASCALISINDTNGTTTATIVNGKDGAKGDKGDPGETGAQGIRDEKADKGDPGIPGADGAKGVKGDKGDKGDTGSTGKAGADGHTPVKGVDYFTDADKNAFLDEMDAVRYVAQNLMEAQKAQARANIGATAGEDVVFADSAEWLAENGDTSKKYVLPDGYIYNWTSSTVTTPHDANAGSTEYVRFNNRPAANAAMSENAANAGYYSTPPIEIDNTWSDCAMSLSGVEKIG